MAWFLGNLSQLPGCLLAGPLPLLRYWGVYFILFFFFLVFSEMPGAGTRSPAQKPQVTHSLAARSANQRSRVVIYC